MTLRRAPQLRSPVPKLGPFFIAPEGGEERELHCTESDGAAQEAEGVLPRWGSFHMPSADLKVLDVTQTLAGTPSSEECQLDKCRSCECCQRAALGLPSSCRNVGSFKTVRRRPLGEASGKGRGSGSG